MGPSERHHLARRIQVIQHFFCLSASLLDVLSGLNKCLCSQHNRLDGSLQVAKLVTVLIQHSACLLRNLMAPVKALSQLLYTNAHSLCAHACHSSAGKAWLQSLVRSLIQAR